MSNTITNVTPQLLAMGLKALREQAIMPRLVNRSYDTMAAMRGAVINIPIPSAITARSITPSVTINSNVDSSPTVAYVTLDSFYEAPFQLSDTDQLETMADFVPMEASEAVKALINTIDQDILANHTAFYGEGGGTAGTTPFATAITVALTARRKLNEQLAPMTDRVVVLDPAAEANALGLSNILQFDQRGDQGGIINGEIGRKLGMFWYMDQNISTYTAGTAASSGYTVNASAAAAATTFNVVNVTATGTVNVGDIFYLGGGSQGYVITSAVAITASTTAAFYFYPPLTAAVSAAVALTWAGAASASTQLTPNLVFHRDAFAFASRPLMDIQGLGNAMQSVVDPISGVALRLEISRQYKQTTFSYDCLWGSGAVRRELGAKIYG